MKQSVLMILMCLTLFIAKAEDPTPEEMKKDGQTFITLAKAYEKERDALMAKFPTEEQFDKYVSTSDNIEVKRLVTAQTNFYNFAVAQYNKYKDNKKASSVCSISCAIKLGACIVACSGSFPDQQSPEYKNCKYNCELKRLYCLIDCREIGDPQ